MRRITRWFLWPLLCQLLLFDPAAAQVGPSPEKLRVVYSAIGGSQSSLWIPYEAGIFRKYGLDLELLYAGGGSLAAQVVVSGEAPVGIFTGASVVSANLSGGDLVTIASGMNVVPFFLIAAPEIKQIEKLKGKRVAVTRFGSSTHLAVRFAAEHWPIKPERDFAVIQVGGQPEMMAALKSGAVQAAMLNAEFAILARKEGFRELVDVAAIGMVFPTSSLNTTRFFIRSREDTVRRFVRAFAEGAHYAKRHRAESIETLKKYMKKQDPAFLESVYDLYVMRYLPRVPHPSIEAVRTVISQLGERDPRVRGARPEQFIEPRFMQELEQEGFIERLWK